VISGGMILKWKHFWSQVAAALRSFFRQKGSTEIAWSCDYICRTPSGVVQPPGFLKKCRDPEIDELRLG